MPRLPVPATAMVFSRNARCRETHRWYTRRQRATAQRPADLRREGRSPALRPRRASDTTPRSRTRRRSWRSARRRAHPTLTTSGTPTSASAWPPARGRGDQCGRHARPAGRPDGGRGVDHPLRAGAPGSAFSLRRDIQPRARPLRRQGPDGARGRNERLHVQREHPADRRLPARPGRPHAYAIIRARLGACCVMPPGRSTSRCVHRASARRKTARPVLEK